MAFAHYEAHTPAEETSRSATYDRRLTLPLLLLLAAALFGWYRYNDLKSNQAAGTDTAVVATPTVTPGSDAAAARRDTATAISERRPTIARTTPRSSAPEPLAGNPLPEYPAIALRHGEGGEVVLQVRVDEKGQPVDIDFARRSGSRDLDRAAVQAVRDWRFKPAIRNGKPVSAVVELPIDFKPQG